MELLPPHTPISQSVPASVRGPRFSTTVRLATLRQRTAVRLLRVTSPSGGLESRAPSVRSELHTLRHVCPNDIWQPRLNLDGLAAWTRPVESVNSELLEKLPHRTQTAPRHWRVCGCLTNTPMTQETRNISVNSTKWLLANPVISRTVHGSYLHPTNVICLFLHRPTA